MQKNIFNKNNASHIAFVVNNIEESVAQYCEMFKLEMPLFKMTGEASTAQVEYNGKPTLARAKQAFIQLGSLRVEFLEPDEHESIWRTFLEENGEGIHHIAFEITDMDETLAKMKRENMELIQKGFYNGGRYAYIGSEEKFKTIFELLENYE